MKIYKTTENFFPISLILIAISSRLIPHPPNFTPIIAVALFGAYSFQNKIISFTVPLLSMLISDLIIGFHSSMLAVYLSFSLIVFIGFSLRNYFSFKRLFFKVSISSFLFFIITNFAVWLTSGMYPYTFSGLIQCYILGIPFYKTTPLEFFALSYLGDLFYSYVMFGAFLLSQKFIFKRTKI